jgi:murein DD-endopeptidase MepM/ murein hydrolase activator NlpD
MMVNKFLKRKFEISKIEKKFKIRYLGFILLFFPLIYLITNRKIDYNAKYVETLTYEDKIAKHLLEDIKKFNKEYDGKGGKSIDKDLKIALYKIKPGDNLWNIAQKTGLSIDTLLTLNNLENVHIIPPGTEIRIPNKDGIFYKISPGETIEDIAKKFNVSVEDIININELTDEAFEEGKDIFIPKGKLPLEEKRNYLGRFIMPVFGKITSGFRIRKNPITGRKEKHTGIDIACPIFTPVKSAETGRVIFAGEYGGYGKMIIISHYAGYSTRYAHLSKINVSYGEYVKQGQIIGLVGDSGITTGPHLHFELRKYGKPINPFYMLKYTAKK